MEAENKTISSCRERPKAKPERFIPGRHLTSSPAPPWRPPRHGRAEAGPGGCCEAEPRHGPTSAGSLTRLKAAISRPGGKEGRVMASPLVIFPCHDSGGRPWLWHTEPRGARALVPPKHQCRPPLLSPNPCAPGEWASPSSQRHKGPSGPSRFLGSPKLRLVTEEAEGPGEPSDEERVRFYALQALPPNFSPAARRSTPFSTH